MDCNVDIVTRTVAASNPGHERNRSLGRQLSKRRDRHSPTGHGRYLDTSAEIEILPNRPPVRTRPSCLLFAHNVIRKKIEQLMIIVNNKNTKSKYKHNIVAFSKTV